MPRRVASSHYIALETMEDSAAYNPNGQPSRYLRAVCGVVIRVNEHALDPTCAACGVWIKQREAREAAVMKGMGV